MRSALLSLAAIALFFCPAYAAPCYGTKMPAKKEIFAGLQNHIVFKRYLKDDNGKLRSLQNFLLLSWGVFDWFSLDLKGGAGDIKQRPVGSDEIRYATNFSGGYGFRLRLYEKEKTKAVFGFQHISVHPSSRSANGVKNKAVLDDWQFSVLASYDVWKLTPYVGTRWSRVDYIHWTDGNRKREKSDRTKEVGLIFGCDIPVTEKIWVNLEGQWLDSEACAVSVNYKF